MGEVIAAVLADTFAEALVGSISMSIESLAFVECDGKEGVVDIQG